ncbi:MAG: condensation domain-containing protein [Anaerolineales bacterium]
MTDLLQRLQQLSPEQRAALVKRLSTEQRSVAQRLVAYVTPNPDQLAPTPEAMRSFLKPTLPDYMIPSNVVVLDTLPLMPNGKVDYKALPEPEQATDRNDNSFVAPRTPAETTLAQIWVRVLGMELVGVHDNFFEVGGDSLLSIQIVAKARQAGLQITPKQVFDYPTIAELALIASDASAAQSEQGLVTGPAPLTSIQYWLLDQPLKTPDHWNQAVLLRSVMTLNQNAARETVHHLLRQHDALRTRFVKVDGRWQAEQLPLPIELPFSYFYLSGQRATEHRDAIEAAATQLHRSLDLAKGEVFRVAQFDLGAGLGSRLLIIVHHLVTDGVSWRILLEDWVTVYEQLARKAPVTLPAKTTSFQQWSHKLRDYARSAALDSEIEYWQRASQRFDALPRDDADAPNVFGSARRVSATLRADDTRLLLSEALKGYRLTVPELLLTALAQTLTEWTETSTLLVDVEGHGREALFEEADVSRTVGWFTSVYPVALTLDRAAEVGQQIVAIKEQLRAIPNNGIGHGLLLHLREDATFRPVGQAEIVFNYMGQSAQLLPASNTFALADEPSGLARDQNDPRRYVMDVNIWVRDGELEIEWTYSERLHRPETVERLSQHYLAALCALIAHCVNPEAGELAASDFPLAALDQEDFGQLAKLLEQAE